MPRHERTPEAAQLGVTIPATLAEGAIDVLGRMPNASNATFLVRCALPGDDVLAIYKPRDGERPLWDFPEGSLHRREVAAFEIAAALGWPNVPPTVLREGPYGAGSVQWFIHADPAEHFFTLQPERADEFRKVALFDLVINNADRKGGHCLLDAAGTIWSIDHGVCFHEEPKLRTVIWDFIGEPIPAEARVDLERLRTEMEGALGERLAALLNAEQAGATVSRIDRLLASGVFPEPDPSTRPFPWPPI